ncbi:MAG: NADH:flavin oxidoreductase [Thermoanaerobacterales bacterium]|nr:NADH:flavin oxidoreductase [Bacillota bacterium]MDI6906022.1 NADH:flavin oxidoreductase [Thermoanaerobacterales bacterium]
MPNLFSALETPKLSLKNRIVMPPMANNLCAENGAVNDILIAHYQRRAEAEVALLIVEHSYVLPSGRAGRKQLGIHDDALVAGLRRLVDEVHRRGAKIGIQITHAGSNTSSEVLGHQPLAPSPVPHPSKRYNEVPKELSKDELGTIRESFAAAARRAKEAGFDMVEIHGAHGYLLNQFFSPLTNRRDDEYGGSFENRLRFPREVVAAVRQAVGETFCIFYRFGADDQMAGGITTDDARRAAPLLVEAGVDVLDLSGGMCGASSKTGTGFFNYLAEAVKPVVNVPVMVTGGLGDPRQANRVIEEGIADLVGIGRALLADPEWALKAKTVVNG